MSHPVEELLNVNLMKVIINNIIPFKGYTAMTVYPFIFARKPLSTITLNHEYIHGEQQKETLLIFFLLLYVLEYIIKLIITFNFNRAYESISFEREAYMYEHDMKYLSERKRYNWIKYIFSLSNYGA